MTAKSVDCPLRAMFQCTSMHVVVAVISSTEQQASRTSRPCSPTGAESCTGTGQ